MPQECFVKVSRDLFLPEGELSLVRLRAVKTLLISSLPSFSSFFPFRGNSIFLTRRSLLLIFQFNSLKMHQVIKSFLEEIQDSVALVFVSKGGSSADVMEWKGQSTFKVHGELHSAMTAASKKFGEFTAAALVQAPGKKAACKVFVALFILFLKIHSIKPLLPLWVPTCIQSMQKRLASVTSFDVLIFILFILSFYKCFMYIGSLKYCLLREVSYNWWNTS